MIYSEPCSSVLKVRITPDVDAVLRTTAQRQGKTTSEIARDALTWYLSHPSVKTSEKSQ